jgi:hypothetical protein
MSSVLDPYFAELFIRLNQEGLSYRAVCKYLKSIQVEISPQALRSWHVRRSQKIVARAQSLPLSNISQSVSALTMTRNKKTNGLQSPSVDLNLHSTLMLASVPITQKYGLLQAQIAEEERKLEQSSNDLGDRFLVRRNVTRANGANWGNDTMEPTSKNKP